jgi:HJR/Mrr/RecB family endonuclease
MDTRVSQADVRHAQVKRDEIKLAWDGERDRLARARKHRLKAFVCTIACRYLLAMRQFCDRTITRPGGFVNALILGGALFLLGGGIMGLTAYQLTLATAVGSLIGAGFGGWLLVPSDGATSVRIARWKQECIELDSVMIDASKKAAEQERILEEADALLKRLLAVYNSRPNQLLHCRWPEMTGVDFENFLASIFQLLGYDVITTGKTGDQGVDLIVSKSGRKVAIQAKGYPRSTVGNNAVQEAHTGMVFYNCQAAAVITNSEFTPSARELAAKVGCLLVAGHQMRDLIEGLINL